MKKIIEINLNRLNINFSNTEQDAISGNEWYIFDTPDSWEEAYREWMDDVGEDDNPDNIPNESEREQLNKLDNEKAYS
ncbi:MAG: hypothetical protein IPP01_04930 [Saprospiraceae bacterium]|nr:hypothetical protein [Saprospiraceae bacterium]